MLRQPTIEWQVAGACNYDCTYCIQSRKYRKGRPAMAQLERALEFFSDLQGRWEIKCSGGEAFAHSLFMSFIVPQLMQRTEHDISVLTNFSASHRDLQHFAFLTRDRLKVFSASMHLEFEDLSRFLDKAVWFCNQLSNDTRFVVNQVVLPGKEEDALRCKDAFEAEGIRWFPQLFKTKGGVAEYPDAALLRKVIGDHPGPKEANLAPSYLGKRCWAGVEYCTIDKDGAVWSCRTAKRFGEGRLGNIFTGDVKMYPEPYSCPYTICPCTVPANRGMIEGIL
jgi:MoaA/NifB/PqqE/SkfB family radical SAM enzyme